MHKFGSTGILTGYIKQLLASFNLPTIKVYSSKQLDYAQAKLAATKRLNYLERYDVVESLVRDSTQGASYCVPYIKNNKLQIYTNGSWKDLGADSSAKHVNYYDRGIRLPNQTKTFQIRDNVYDFYTHEYLGDYLRFLRDFDNLNLMPLYNCFSNHLCDNLEYSFVDQKSMREISFDITDEQYKIYMLPVKLFKNYTIAVDSDSAIELCCGLFNSHMVTEGALKDIASKTYIRKPSCQFSSPFLYESLVTDLFPDLVVENPDRTTRSYKDQLEQLALLAQQERDLKLFIKVPSELDSSIVVLEGDYRTWNDFSFNTDKPIEENKLLDSATIATFVGKYNVDKHSVFLSELKDPENSEDIKYFLGGEFNYTYYVVTDTPPGTSIEQSYIYLEPSTHITPTMEIADHTIKLRINSGHIQVETSNVSTDLPLRLTLKMLEEDKVKVYLEDTLKECTNFPETHQGLYVWDVAKNEATSEVFLNYLVQDLLKIFESPLIYTKKHSAMLETSEQTSRLAKQYNKSVISNELIASQEEIALISPLQLLRLNTKVQTPFSDRLIEYLVGNVITNSPDEISENITLAQTVAKAYFAGASAKSLSDADPEQAFVYRYSPEFFGLWDNALRNIFYQYMTNKVSFENTHDILGYVDKDVEKLFAAEQKHPIKGTFYKTMINTDLWEEN